jgi:UDP-N-acetylglucosamine 2-epimerase (non-hydrolysing)
VAEGVPVERIIVTGNTALETLRAAAARMRGDAAIQSELDQRLGFLRSESPLLMVADPRITNRGFEAIGRALRRLAVARPDLDIVYAAEAGAEAVGPIGELLRADANIHPVPRSDVLAFAYLLGRAHLVVAASSETAADIAALERPVLLVQGDGGAHAPDAGVRQIAVQEDAIFAEVSRLLADPQACDGLKLSTHGTDSAPCQRVAETLASLREGAPTPGPHAVTADLPLCPPVEDLREAS